MTKSADRYSLIVLNAQGASEETKHSTLDAVSQQIGSWDAADMTARVYNKDTGALVYEGAALDFSAQASRTIKATAARLTKERTQGKNTPLERARVAKGWTQEELSREAMVSLETVRRIEDGKPTTTTTLEKLAAAMGVSPAHLAGWT